MVKGKKHTAENIVFKNLKLLQKSLLKKNFEAIMKLSVVNCSPTLYVKQIQRKRKKSIEFPFLLQPNKKIFYGLRNLINSCRKTRLNKFFINFNEEIVKISTKNSLVFKSKINLHQEAFVKKKFANYRWF